MATLAPDTPPDPALRQIVAECHADLLKHRAIVLAGRRAVGIHQTRVALRRLRAALGLFRGAVDGLTEGRLVRALAAEAKWLAGECAPARDLHVFLTETVEEMPLEVKRIAARLAKAHLDRARTALSGARYNAFEGQLTAFVQAAPAHRPRRRPAGRFRPRPARAAPRQGRAARPASREPRPQAPAQAPHRDQEAALCRGLPAARLCLGRRRKPISRRQCACRARSAP